MTSGDATRGAQIWRRVARVVVGVLVPLVLVLTNVRLLLTHGFVRLEYASPGFPADPYGFSRADRERWAGLALDYLLNDAGASFLSDLRFPDGSPLYDKRELSHMVDVKRLVRSALAAWGYAAIVLALVLLLEWRIAGRSGVAGSLWLGGRVSLILMALLVGVLVVSFSFLFVGFHELFFQGGTWTFFYSDTLIRLFPERFWQIAFGSVLILTLAEGGLLMLLTRRTPSAAAGDPSGVEPPGGDAAS